MGYFKIIPGIFLNGIPKHPRSQRYFKETAPPEVLR
jgi:hypothetical protein